MASPAPERRRKLNACGLFGDRPFGASAFCGFTTPQHEQADPKLAPIPVILLRFVDEKRKGFALGALAYLTKPVDVAQLAEADTGGTGLESVAEHTPKPILLDPMMPEVGGFAFLHELRSTEAGRAILVVVTAKDITEDDLLRLRGNVSRIVPKEASTTRNYSASTVSQSAPHS